jgi:hypothetical protein
VRQSILVSAQANGRLPDRLTAVAELSASIHQLVSPWISAARAEPRGFWSDFHDAAATFGNTPLVEFGRVAKNLPGRIVAKLEMRNSCGSVKDHFGAALIEDAE